MNKRKLSGQVNFTEKKRNARYSSRKELIAVAQLEQKNMSTYREKFKVA